MFSNFCNHGLCTAVIRRIVCLRRRVILGLSQITAGLRQVMVGFGRIMANSPTYSLTDICPQGVYSSHPNGTFVRVFPDADVKFSPKSKYAVWPQGYLTRLPWISDNNDPDVNVIPHVRRPPIIRSFNFFLLISTA